MKYINRLFPLLLVLALLVTCFVFPVSAAETDTESVALLSLGNAGGDDGYISVYYGDTVYELDVMDLTYWADYVNEGRAPQGFTVSLGTSNIVNFTIDGVGTFLICDANGNVQAGSKAITDEVYYLNALIEFTITEFDPFTEKIGIISYSFSETVLGGFTLGQLVANKVFFHHSDIGLCQFVYEGDTDVIVFAVGKKADGTFTKRYMLMTAYEYAFNFMLTSAENTLISGDYYAIDPCRMDYHSYGAYETVSKATCTAEGKSVAECKFCGNLDTVIFPALEHDVNFWGTCRVCGTNVVKDFFTGGGADNSGGDSGNTDVGAGGGDGDDSNGGDDSSGGFFAGIGKFFNNVGDGITDGVTNIGTWFKELFSGFEPDEDTKKDEHSLWDMILLILGFVGVVIILPIIAPILKLFGEGLSWLFKNIGKMFKKIGAWAKKQSASDTGSKKKGKKK